MLDGTNMKIAIPEKPPQSTIIPIKKSRAVIDNEQSGTFSPNMKLPVHRWFRYSAGFSAEWVKKVINESSAKKLLDPFVGSGTVCIEADKVGVPSYGIESHPFIYRLAKGKVSWATNIEDFQHTINELEKCAKRLKPKLPTKISSLLKKCYSNEALIELFRLRAAYLKLAQNMPEGLRSLIFLAINAILRPSSHVGTAQWQYVLPNKKKAKVRTPADALKTQSLIMIDDMRQIQGVQTASKAILIQSDARTLDEIADRSIDLVITSPPYANNYDYADATRLEMTFWGEVDSWGDLHEAVRKFLICSNSQHASKEQLDLETLLKNTHIEPIRDELTAVCQELSIIRGTKGGNKAYHTMIAAYFVDMAKTLNALRRVTTQGSNLCLVIGDSAPYGVHAPAEKWLGQLALAVGFHDWSFDKIRERNMKWKNRKHTVPLHEGRLWIKG